MSDPNTPLEFLQDEIHDRIAAWQGSNSAYAGVALVKEIEGLTDNDIDAALAEAAATSSKAGAAIIVPLPVFQVESPDAPGPIGSVLIEIEIYEDRITNQETNEGTGKSAEHISLLLANLLHHFTPHPFDGLRGTAIVGNIEPLPSAGPRVGYVVPVTIPVGVVGADKVAVPTITDNGDGTATITCATSGAAIYYTTDETYPYSGNSTATRYPDILAGAGTDVIVAGAGTAAADGTYSQDGTHNGKAAYTQDGGSNWIKWIAGAWTLSTDALIGNRYTSTDDVATPDLTTTWTTGAYGADPPPNGPISVSSGDTIRAGATKTDNRPSDVAYATIA